MVPTTFSGTSKDKATSTNVIDDFHPVAGMASASKMPSGSSTASTAAENRNWFQSASCRSPSRITAANHSVPTNTRRSGEMMSCTE
ncbi:hypothetical protein D3C72_2448900 [compost metagenome]